MIFTQKNYYSIFFGQLHLNFYNMRTEEKNNKKKHLKNGKIIVVNSAHFVKHFCYPSFLFISCKESINFGKERRKKLLNNKWNSSSLKNSIYSTILQWANFHFIRFVNLDLIDAVCLVSWDVNGGFMEWFCRLRVWVGIEDDLIWQGSLKGVFFVECWNWIDKHGK